MKLSISLPEKIAREIRELSERTDRSISWWIQRAWTVARERLESTEDLERAEKLALSKMRKLRGSLKDSYSGQTSVDLAHRAFKSKK